MKKWVITIFLVGVMVVCSVGYLDSQGDIDIENVLDVVIRTFAGESVDENDNRTIGYEYITPEILHIWNNQDDYYANASNGMQFSNHFEEYWSHNVFCLGYQSGNDWNIIKCVDELDNFNKDIHSDNLTYVNATLWKDITYAGYDIRLAVRYSLYQDDKSLTIIPYIKNIGVDDIPYNLGFAWRMRDIKVRNNVTDNWMWLVDTPEGSEFFLNESIHVNYTNLTHARFIIFADDEFLRLDWDKNLNYKLMIDSVDGQYNAPVTLGINAGTLAVGQEKSTELYWIDAITVDDTSADTDAGTSSLTVAHDTTGTANTVLFVTVQVTDSSLSDRTISTVTYDGVLLHYIALADSDDGTEEHTEIWYLNSPNTGSNNIVVTAGGTCTDLTLGAISLTGVADFSLVANHSQRTAPANNEHLYSGTSLYYGQSFKGNGNVLSSAGLLVIKDLGAPTGTITAHLYSHTGTYGDDGTPNSLIESSSTILDVTDLATSFGAISGYNYVTFLFSGDTILEDGVPYFIVLDASNIQNSDSSNYISMFGSSLNVVGNGAYSSDGDSWTSESRYTIFYVMSHGSLAIDAQDSTPIRMNVTVLSEGSYVIDAMAISENNGATISADYNAIHKTDVGGDTHGSQYNISGVGNTTMSYTYSELDQSWVMSAVSVEEFRILIDGDLGVEPASANIDQDINITANGTEPNGLPYNMTVCMTNSFNGECDAFDWDVLVDEAGSNYDSSSFILLGDDIDNTYAESVMLLFNSNTNFTPNYIQWYSGGTAPGDDYIDSMVVNICEYTTPDTFTNCVVVDSDYNPPWNVEIWNTIYFESDFFIHSGKNYSIEFVTPNSNNDNGADYSRFYFDNTIGDNRMFAKMSDASSYTSYAYYPAIKIFGTKKFCKSNMTTSGEETNCTFSSSTELNLPAYAYFCSSGGLCNFHSDSSVSGTIVVSGTGVDSSAPTYSSTQINTTSYLVDTAYQINRSVTDATGVAWCNFSTNLTAGQTWVNFSNQSFTGSPVKAQINVSTPSGWEVADEIGFMLSCCDEVATPNCGSDSEFTYEITSADTCNPTSPLTADYDFDCDDNCVETGTLDCDGNSITTSNKGSGSITFENNPVGCSYVTLGCAYITQKG